MNSKKRTNVLEDDILSDDSLELESDDDNYHFSSDDHEDELDSNEKNEEPPVKKVATIMNKLLTDKKEGSAILSKAKIKKEPAESKEEKKVKSEKLLMKRNWLNAGRVKPNRQKDYEKDRKLRIIATQGVIQLFRTIEKHRFGLKEELKSTKTVNEREKILAKKGLDSFMNILEEEGQKIRRENDFKMEIKDEPSESIKFESADRKNNQWSVFASNYYEEPSLAGWDKGESDDDT